MSCSPTDYCVRLPVTTVVVVVENSPFGVGLTVAVSGLDVELDATLLLLLRAAA